MSADGNRRRKRICAGIVVMVCTFALTAALFTTPLERSFLSGRAWFLIVSGLYAVSAALFFLAWSMIADRLGVAALSLGLVMTLILAGFVLVFVMISALSGLR